MPTTFSVAPSLLWNISLITFLVWIGWRVWRFTLTPLLWPHEPPCYPYLIPVLGHAIPFFRNSYKVFEGARRHFGNTRPVYTLVVAGQSLYVITDPKDTQELYKNSSSLSWESFVKELFQWIGYSPTSIGILWRAPTEEERITNPKRHLPPVHMMEEQQRQQLLPGKKSAILIPEILSRISSNFIWETASKNADIVTSRRDAETIEVELLNWTTHVLVGVMTEVYWGEELLKINPRLIHDFIDWEHSVWKYLVQLPSGLSKDMLQARKSLIGSFSKYFDLPPSQRQRTNWWVTAAEAEFRDAGLGSNDIGRAHMLSHWAVNGNMHKVAFWILTHILHDAELRETIERETLPAFENKEKMREILSSQCPNLDAVWHEVLRMRMATSLMRSVVRDTPIGHKILRKGRNVLVPYKELHNNEGIWGVSPELFDKRRFLNKTKGLSANPSYRPFGGGAHLCPGRFMAKEIVYTFVMLALHSFNPVLNIEKGCGKSLPRPREQKPALGSLPPMPEDEVFLWLHQKH